MSSTHVYHGSCHCGDVKYQMRLTLPPSLTPDPFVKSTRIYKCNCSTCHKMGMFHCRPIDTYEDFIMTSPSSPEELGEYRAFSGKIAWYFCKKCGVRPFGIGGNWVQEELDVENWAGKESDGKLEKVWRSTPLKDIKGFDGSPLHYVSANAVTLEGVDLIEWQDKKWIFYVENIKREDGKRGDMRFAEPFPGGCY